MFHSLLCCAEKLRILYAYVRSTLSLSARQIARVVPFPSERSIFNDLFYAVTAVCWISM